MRRSTQDDGFVEILTKNTLKLALFAAHPHFTVSELGEVPASILNVHPIGVDPMFLILVPLLAFPLNYQFQCHLHTPGLSA
jgi:hypothetical protein